MARGLARTLALGALLAVLPGCWSLYRGAAWVAMPFLYRRAELPESQILRDVSYHDASGVDPEKQRLDLFLPAPGGGPAPVLIFVHGGGWTSGDKGYRMGGQDVYGNIGRFFAGQGVVTAVISYRLQPDVTWRQQLEDVAEALAWVHAHAAEHGGDPERIFLAGHSAGGYLAARVALDEDLREREGAPPVCGLVAVSGAAYDLVDEETYALGASRAYYEQRFRDEDAGSDWALDASVLRLVTPQAPPALVFAAANESAPLKRQAVLLHQALRQAGVSSEFTEVPGVDHYRIVPTLSRPDRITAEKMLEFIRRTPCRTR